MWTTINFDPYDSFQLTGSGGCGPHLGLAQRPAEMEFVHEQESVITRKLSLGDENVPDPHRKHDPAVLAHVPVSNIFIGALSEYPPVYQPNDDNKARPT